MAALAKIDELIRVIDCAVVHPAIPSGEVHRKRSQGELRGGADVTELYPIIYELYKSVETSMAFREPVNALKLGILDYYHRIKSPMSLRTVLDKLADPSGAHYSTKAQVMADLDLIWRNCEAYNGAQHLLTEAARQCEGWVAAKLQELEDNRIADNDAVEEFNELFMEEAERDQDATDGLIEFVKRLNSKLLTAEGDLDLENLTAGELKAMHGFLRDHIARKRGRE